jgi:formylglycine-generating enzyme required for sulfatase activity
MTLLGSTVYWTPLPSQGGLWHVSAYVHDQGPEPALLNWDILVGAPWQPVDRSELVRVLPAMVHVKAAGYSFVLGAGRGEWYDYKLVHFTYDFYMDTTEVTVGAYRELLGDDPSGGLDSDGWPVAVAIQEAALYCNARSKRDGLDTVYDLAAGTTYLNRRGYRLPTIAEWGYACRAGTPREEYWGDADPDLYAWTSWDTTGPTLHPHQVARKLPSAYGLYDMLGNRSEWCVDRNALPLCPDMECTDPVRLSGDPATATRGAQFTTGKPGLRCVLPLTIPESWKD